MFSIMFNNIGGKIKTLAVVVCVFIAVACVVVGIGIVMIAHDDITIFLGVSLMTGGPFLAWVGSFLIYGFGQLVESAENTDKKMVSLLARLDAGIPVRTMTEIASSGYTGAASIVKEDKYSAIVSKMSSANTSEQFTELARDFRTLGDYKDSNDLAKECERQAKVYAEAENASYYRSTYSPAKFDLTKPVADAEPPKDEDFVALNNCRCADCNKGDMPMITAYVYEGVAKKKVTLCRPCFMARLTAKYKEEISKQEESAARSRYVPSEKTIEEELDNRNFYLRQDKKCDGCGKYNKKLAMEVRTRNGVKSEQYFCRECLKNILSE